jgi:NAD(P)-dependent dehydrogenase (short-subunit alcohol dehydrogenase family)
MSEIRYDGRVAIVTGAGGGLGKTYALLLGSRGASVVVNDLGGQADGTGSGTSMADEVVKEIIEAGGQAVANYDSVSTPEGGDAIVKTAVDNFGKVDILINNAGILRDKSFVKLEPQNLEAVLDVHLKGAFFVTQPAFRLMKENSYGRIIFTSSGAGIFGNFGQTNYGAAKMGLVGLCHVLAAEGGKYNIKCNAIAPVAKTRLTEALLGGMADALDASVSSPTRSSTWEVGVTRGSSWAWGRVGSPRRARSRRPRTCATTSTRFAAPRATSFPRASPRRSRRSRKASRARRKTCRSIPNRRWAPRWGRAATRGPGTR